MEHDLIAGEQNPALYYKRSNILREYEIYCYRICFYLLECEKLALQAAETTLYQLFFDHLFYLQDDKARKMQVLKASINGALHLYKKGL